MDLAKYHSQVIKDIDHYVARTKIGNILKSEQKEETIDNKKVMAFDVIIQLKKYELIKIEGKNNEDIYKFVEKLNLKDKEITTLDVEKIYREKYKINILDIENLKFD